MVGPRALLRWRRRKIDRAGVRSEQFCVGFPDWGLVVGGYDLDRRLGWGRLIQDDRGRGVLRSGPLLRVIQAIRPCTGIGVNPQLGCGRNLHRDGGDEAVSGLRNGLDNRGGAGVIAEDIADLRDAADQNVVADEGVPPDGFDEPLLGENLIRMKSQMDEHLHHLGFEVPALASFFNRVDLGLDQPILN